jgi:hypothetical protein
VVCLPSQYKLTLGTRYATVILNPSKNPHRKEVVAEISACILKKHAEGGNPAEYWDRNEQETRLTFAFEKWSCEGTVWSAGARRVSLILAKPWCKLLTSISSTLGSRGAAETCTERVPRTSTAGHTHRWKSCGGLPQGLELAPACAYKWYCNLHRALP